MPEGTVCGVTPEAAPRAAKTRFTTLHRLDTRDQRQKMNYLIWRRRRRPRQMGTASAALSASAGCGTAAVAVSAVPAYVSSECADRPEADAERQTTRCSTPATVLPEDLAVAAVVETVLACASAVRAERPEADAEAGDSLPDAPAAQRAGDRLARGLGGRSSGAGSGNGGHARLRELGVPTGQRQRQGQTTRCPTSRLLVTDLCLAWYHEQLVSTLLLKLIACLLLSISCFLHQRAMPRCARVQIE